MRDHELFGRMVLLFAVASGAPARGEEWAETILRGGKVVSGDAVFSTHAALAIAGGKVLRVGSEEDILRLRGPGTIVIDLEGRTVIPGLIDTHVHPTSACMTEYDHAIPEMESIADVLAHIRSRAAAIEEGRWIEVHQVFITRLREQRYPTREELDAAAPRHPVIFATGPDASLSSLALARSGIDRSFAIVDGGPGRIERDPATGEPTGILRSCTRLVKVEPSGRKPSEADIENRLLELFRDYTSVGITSIVDRDASAGEIERYRRLHDAGRLPLRLAVSQHIDTLGPIEEVVERVRQVARGPLREPSSSLRVLGIKTYLDGGMLTGSAYMREPWGVSKIYSITDPQYRGVLFIPPERLLPLVREAVESNLQFTAHSVGDGAVHALLDAYEEVDRATPIRPTRPCITHSNFMSREAVLRAARLGVLVDVQPAWLHLDARTLREQFGDERLRYFQPLRSIFEAGGIACGGSDHMQKIGSLRAVNPYNPFLGMATAVTRRSRWLEEPLHPEEALTREQALRLYTLNGARLMMLEDRIGSLEPGKLADFAVLDRDILSCPIGDVVGTSVVATYIEGRRVYDRASGPMSASLPLPQEPNTWVKRSPLDGGPPSPRLGYEGDCVWDPHRRVLLRHAGHNQGGGGEQGSEVWTFEPLAARWTLHEPNTSPPGVCCEQQNVFDPLASRYLRFPSFSGSHGWQWQREIYLNEDSVWAYDPGANLWRARRPYPAPRLAPLRCASWDSDRGVVVVFGGEGSREGTLVYDSHRNEWTRKAPRQEPEPRSGGNMTYDPARKLHLLFGSQFSDDPHTWAYDLAQDEWRDLKPATLPPSDRNDAVLAHDALHGLSLAIVKLTAGEEEQARHRLETWLFDAARAEWRRAAPPAEPDPSGNRARVLAFAPELGLTLLESCTHPPQGKREQQIWSYRAGDRPPAPSPVPAPRDGPAIAEDLVVSVVSARQVELRWSAPRGGAAGYHVERAAVEVWSEDQLARLKSRTPPLSPPSVGAVRRVGPFRRLTAEPVATTTWSDRELDLAQPAAVEGEPVHERKLGDDHLDAAGARYRLAVYAYRVRGVSEAGVEGGPSPATFTFPSPPQWLFAREQGTTCELRWAPNPETGIRGYRVYRLDGRYDSEPVARLTPEPVTVASFADAGAGKSTRRYHVVAVDALGQEGQPSAPVWFEREWKEYYLPFTGEWHQ